MARKGTSHVNIVVSSAPRDGFPNYTANCECGWESVIHQREEIAQAEASSHNTAASRAPRAAR